MNELSVRLLSIELNNFKNVEHGKIELPKSTVLAKSGCKIVEGFSDIIGIYGQNGSGKTAIIDALSFLQLLIIGAPLPEDSVNYIGNIAEEANLHFKFYTNIVNRQVLLTYHFSLTKTPLKKVEIAHERITFSELINDKWTRETPLIDYYIDDEVLFTPKYRLEQVLSNNKDNVINLNVAKVVAKKECKSFIFSDEAFGIWGDCSPDDEVWNLTLVPLRYFAISDLFVIKNIQSGIINVDFGIPFSYKDRGDGLYKIGKFIVSLSEPSIFESEKFQILEKMIEEMNLVIKALIPGLSIAIKNYGPQLTETGKSGIRFELFSLRGNSTIPLKYESDGIKKILSILNILVAMYNNPSICLAIDELDAGIYEYLLGELLKIIQESGRGQLIFTSHNLRPLEMIDKNSLIFTTTNPSNRYIKLTNVKSNNNLRDLYLRYIMLGGQKEIIYEPTKDYEIRRSLREAGSNING